MAIVFEVDKKFDQIDEADDGIINNAGETITYTFTVSNESTAGESFDDLFLTDPLLGLAGFDLLQAVSDGDLTLTGDDGDFILEPGESWLFEENASSGVFTYTVTQADIDSNGSVEPGGTNTGFIDNEGTVNGSLVGGGSFNASGSAGVAVVQDPSIDIEKATNGQDADTPTGPEIVIGDAVNWTYEVTNDGNLTLTNVVVTDDNGTPGDVGDDFSPTPVDVDGDGSIAGDDPDDNDDTVQGNGTLDPGETWYYEASGTAEAGQYGNISDVSALGPQEQQVTDSDPSHYFGVNVDIDIEKATNGQDADSPTGPLILVGDTATFTYLVTNPGDVALTNVVVTDDNGTPGDTGDDFNPDPVLSGGFNVGDTDQDNELDPGESWEYTASTTVTAGQYTNGSSVSGDYEESTVTDDDPSNHYGVDPQIDIEKATNGDDADSPTGPVIPVGDTATFTYVVTNAGNVEIENVVVEDDNGTPGDTGDDFNPTAVESGGFNVGDTDQDGLLDPGESWEYTASTTVTEGQYTNISTVTGTDVELGSPVSDSDPSNHYGQPPSEPGSANTPGFWKNHLDIFECETGYDRDDEYEDVFGLADGAVDARKVPDDPTLEDALNAKGGGQAALLRASTAGMANALSDDTNYTYTDDGTMAEGIYEVFGLMPGDPGYDDALADVRDVLDEVDTNDNGAIEFGELQSAVQDAFADEEYNELAQALDVMNNQPSVEVQDFLGCYEMASAQDDGPPPWAGGAGFGTEDGGLHMV